jgi:hypothetical protein
MNFPNFTVAKMKGAANPAAAVNAPLASLLRIVVHLRRVTAQRR